VLRSVNQAGLPGAVLQCARDVLDVTRYYYAVVLFASESDNNLDRGRGTVVDIFFLRLGERGPAV